MKGITGWSYTPYVSLNATETQREFYVCSLQPFEKGFVLEYRDCREGHHTLLYRRRGTVVWQEMPARRTTVRAEGLEDGQDYETAVRREDGAMTAVRLVRTGKTVGTVINYLHPEDTVYAFSGHCLCSPSIVRMPSGRLLASMDVYAPQAAQDLTLIFESLDDGATWQYVTELFPCFWGKLFCHHGKLYMLAMACEYGDLLIGVSENEGHTWQPPVRLFNGTNARECGPHKAPMPIIAHQGRIYTAIDYGSWKYGGHSSCILSVTEDADLLQPKNWSLTTPLPFDPAWPGLPIGRMKGCLEGNVFVSPQGTVCNMLRLQQNEAMPDGGKAVLLEYVDADSPLAFRRVVDFPLGANSKFVVLQANGWYIAVGNEYFSDKLPAARTVLSVAISCDLVHWHVVERLLDAREEDSKAVAFQYPDAILEGDDLLVVSRTAMNGAESFHNSNMITFHRVTGFFSRLTQKEAGYR